VGGAFHVNRTSYKGSTEEKAKQVREDNLRQAMEKRRREKEEESYDQQWEKQRRRYAIATRILDNELQSRNKDKHVEITNINRELAEEQKLRQCYMNNMMYRGQFTSEFFDQFNTTTR
jgi:hypothetical protein